MGSSAYVARVSERHGGKGHASVRLRTIVFNYSMSATTRAPARPTATVLQAVEQYSSRFVLHHTCQGKPNESESKTTLYVSWWCLWEGSPLTWAHTQILMILTGPCPCGILTVFRPTRTCKACYLPSQNMMHTILTRLVACFALVDAHCHSTHRTCDDSSVLVDMFHSHDL